MLVVLKTMHLFLASTAALLLSQPEAVLGSSPHRSLVGKPPPFPIGRDGNKEERYIIDPKSEAYYADGLDGRSSGDDPICVNVKKTFEVRNEDYCFNPYFAVTVQVDTPLKCRATALNSLGSGAFLGLSMNTDDWNYGGQYCSVGSQYGSVECSIGLIMNVYVQVEYYGNATTIEVTCTNDPCTAPVCGDGFCSAGLELPVTPLKKTNATCKEDCGYSCGDGNCDADMGETESTCLRDCGYESCVVLDEVLALEANETTEFQFELMDGEDINCYQNCECGCSEVTVAMRYDEPACPYPYQEYIWWHSNEPTAAPTSSVSPNYTPACYEDNVCNSNYGCYSYPSNGTQTLYVTIFAPYGNNGSFKCYKGPCVFPETNPPTPEPVASPVVTPAPTPAPFICFSKDTEVEVLGQGTTRMEALQIGDAVLDADGSFSPVYSFAHYEPQRAAEFFQIWTKAARRPLEITADHMLSVMPAGQDKAQMLPARAVQVGDMLVSPSSSTVKVTAISRVQREGLYAPATTTGTIVVNGVVASNYIALPAAFAALASFDRQHWLQHMAYAPYRLYCGATGCPNETYDPVTGLSPAVMAWLPVLHLAEWTLVWSSHLIAAVLGYGVLLVWKKQHQQQGFKALSLEA